MQGSELAISVLVPALNEQSCIVQTLEEVGRALDATFPDSEILAFDDGSVDATGSLMEEQAIRDPRIRVVHHASPMGLGRDYWEAAQTAKGTYLIMVPGDGENPGSSVESLLREAGNADIVSCYVTNPSVRKLKRRIVSRTYVSLINMLFGHGLKYYNGTCLVRTSLVRDLPQPTPSFAYMTEVLVQLLDRKATIKEVGTLLRPHPSGKTSAFKTKNVTGVLGSIGGMFWKLRIAPLFA